MGTPISFDVESTFKAPQPKELLTNVKDLEGGVAKLLELAETSQSHLIRFLEAVKKNNEEINMKIVNPGKKSYDSALRKAKEGYGVPNRLLMLADPYRASIIVESYKHIEPVNNWIQKEAEKNGFKIIWVRNYFDKPWSGGYREINIRVADTTNQNIVGEIQILLCTIKKFSLLAGHKSFEITRTLHPKNNPSNQSIKNALEQVTRYGYNLASKYDNIGCLKNIENIQTKMPKGGKRKTNKKKKVKKGRKTYKH